MSVQKRHMVLLCVCLLTYLRCKASVEYKESVCDKLKTEQQIFSVGDPIVLNFNCDTTTDSHLIIETSYGSTILTSSTGTFDFPEILSQKLGIIQYTLVQKGLSLCQGKLTIQSDVDKLQSLETYVGPPSIIAGGEETSMQVVLPLDRYDNPLPDQTKILCKHQFLGEIKTDEVVTHSMIGWKKIVSTKRRGKILVSSKLKQINSKAFVVDVFPSTPVDFKIISSQEHLYADGNQLITFKTDVIKDAYQSIVSDGTLVTFRIINSTGAILQAQGSTIHGIAMAKLLHPDHQDCWQVQAFIDGFSTSNRLNINFEAVLKDFEIKWSKHNREVSIGPLTSFMGQVIPDGILVKLVVFKDKNKLNTLVKTTDMGVVSFLITEGLYPNGCYDFEMTALGIKKSIHQIDLF